MSLHITTLLTRSARLASGLVFFLFLVAPAPGSAATCPTCNTWKPLRVGGGGYLTGIEIASDGTKVVRTDTYGAYVWNAAVGEWQQMVTATSIPAADISFDDLGGGVYEVAIAESNHSTFYMVWHGYVYKSTNRGLNWTRTSFVRRTDLDPNDQVRTLGQKMAIDPANENVVYVGTVSNGVWRTLDGGTTWSQVTAIPAGTQAPGHAGIAFDPSSGVIGGRTKVIYVPSYGNGVWRSADAGSTWSNVTGSGPANVWHAQVATDGVYYCADGSSAYRYAAGAWTTLHSNGWFGVAVDPANPAHIILGGGRTGDGNSLRQSFDRGNTWVGNADYYPWSPGMTKTATDVPWLAWTKEDWFSFGDQKIDPTDGKLYQAEGIGVWKTSFPATWAPWTWNSQSKGIEQLVANAMTVPPGGKPVLASWDRPLFYSADPDVFPATHGPNRDNSIVMGWGLDYAFGNPDFVAANVTWWGLNESGYSADGGQTWTPFASWPFTDPGGGIAVSTPSNMVAWAQASGGRPYYTTNGGASWTPVTLPGVTSWANFHFVYYLARHVIAADRVTAGTFYLYHTDYGVFRTTNGGATWSLMEPSINTGAGNAYNAKLKSVPGKAGHLFFTAGDQGGSTAGAFMHSTNGGDTWTAIPNVLEVIDFGLGKEAPGASYPTIFIAGWVNNVYGFWRSENEGQSWTNIGDFPLGSLDVIKTIEGDMNTYGTVYVGYAGSGFAYGTLPSGAPPVVSIGDASVTEGNAGTTTAQFTVSLSTGSTQTVTVNYATVNGTAQAGTDYVAASGSVSFSPGSVQRTINVTVNGDTAVEPNETFFVNLGSPTNATLGDAQGAGTIVNDDTAPLPALSISDATVTEGNSETVTAQFTVSLSAPSTQTVTVNYATANGTAQAGTDYMASSGSLSFSPGSVQQTITVTVNGDIAVEPNETFLVNLASPANATLGDAQGVGTIVNDDVAPLPALSISDAAVTEGNSGTVTAQFTVSLSAASTQTVTVAYSTANGSALAGSDYVAASGTLTFSPATLQQTINVTVNGDTTVEPNETFLVNLGSPANATLGDAQGVGTIVNDDVAPLPALTISDATVTEGNSGTVTAQFTVSLSAASTQTVTVNYATADGTAQAGSDYVAASGSLSFAPGSVQKTITVTVNGDTTVEPNETFLVNLGSPANATLGDAQGVGTIVNDDVAPLPALSISDAAITEGNSGTVTAQFTVSLSAASTQTVTVNYATADGTAQAGSDYVAASGSLSFAPGSVQKTITVTANGDTTVEPNETFLVNLGSPANATLGDAQGVGTIVNDDVAPLPALSISDAAITEGNSGTVTAQFTVSLSAASTQTVTVNYATADGTAQAGSDYVAASGSLSFAPGSVQKTITVTVNGDTTVEPNETFLVNLGSPANATLGDAQGVGTIVNDDVAPLPALSISDAAVTEGNSGTVTAQFTVSLSAASAQTVTVAYSTANGSALAGSDYVAASGTLTFSPATLQQTINVTVNGDTTVEPNETFLVNLGSPANATLADGQALGTIIDDDSAPAGEAVVWTAAGGVAVSGNLLTKNAPSGWANAGAASTKILASGDGYVEFTAQETNTFRLLGLSTGDYNWNWDDIDYALYPLGDGTLRVYERGILRGLFGPYASGDKLRIAVMGNVVRYYRNGSLIYTSATPPTYPLLVDASLFTNGATLAGAVISGPWATSNKDPVSWTSVVGASAAAGNLMKTAVAGWGNAGAVSTRFLALGDGFVEHTVQETNTYRMLGLSHGNASNSWDDIDFAIYPMADSTLRVYEKGALRGNFGPYAVGDRLRVAVVGGVVRYYRNAVLLYTSAVAPTYPLIVDTALFNTGATLTNVVISRNWVCPNNEPVVWTNAGGVSVSGNNLTMTAPIGWGNAGAVSTKSLLAGDGYVEHTIQETNTFRIIGLSNGDSNMSWDDIDFGFYPLANGKLRVYEKGVFRGNFGKYEAGDKLRVAVVGGLVNYYRNGILLYTSPMAPTYPLLVDTALYMTGATLREVVISRNFQ